MTLRRLPRGLFALAAFASTLPAHACAVCDSPTGRSLRAGLFNDHFLHTLLVVLAPVPVFVGLVVLLHLGMPDLTLPQALEDPVHNAFSPALELAK